MENRAHALVAGFFILLLSAFLAVSLWWFSDEKTPMKDYVLVSRSAVNNLNEQARVRFRGIPAGRVTTIEIDPNDPRNILVNIQVRSDFTLTKGTTAMLATQGVTGLAYVKLDDRGTDLTPLVSEEGGGPPRIALGSGLLDQMTDTALDVAVRFKEAADRIATLFNDENMKRLNNLFERLESAAVGVDKTFSEAPQVLEALHAVLNKESVANVSQILENIKTLSGEAKPVVEEAHVLLSKLTAMTERFESVAVAAGESGVEDTVPQLNELLHELTMTSRRLGALLREIEETPQVLITGRSERLPGPGETGFNSGHP